MRFHFDQKRRCFCWCHFSELLGCCQFHWQYNVCVWCSNWQCFSAFAYPWFHSLQQHLFAAQVKHGPKFVTGALDSKSCLAAKFIESHHCTAAFSLQVPKSCTHLDFTLFYILIFRTYTKFVRKDKMLQPIADRMAQNLEIISKKNQVLVPGVPGFS